MKILVTCRGSTGDVYPVLALSERLLERGHQVRACAPAIYRDKILEIDVEFHEIGVPFDLSEFQEAMDTTISKRNPLAMLRFMVEERTMRRGERWYQDCLTATKGFDVVTGLLQTPLFYTSFRCVTILSCVHPAVMACSTAQVMVLLSVSRDTARQASPMVVSTV